MTLNCLRKNEGSIPGLIQWVKDPELPLFFYLFIFLVFLPFLGPLPQHVEVPRLGVLSELPLQAYAIAAATWDPSCVCNLCHTSLQCWILNPLNEARDLTPILMDASRVHNPLSHSGNSPPPGS